MPSSTLSSIRARGARQASSVGPPELRRRRLANPSVFLFVILTAQLMVILDSTIVNVALPHIQAEPGLLDEQPFLGAERLHTHLRRPPAPRSPGR